MITTRPYTNSIYQTSITDYYNGVLKLGDGESYGTGNLLYDGRSLLTAAHVFDGRNYDRLKIYLYDGVNNFTAYASIKHHIYYDEYDLNDDIAIVTFEQTFDYMYQRYQLYRDNSEINKKYTAVGYGDVGTGYTGETNADEIYKLKTTNTFDADLKTLMDYANETLPWKPIKDAILISDFDNGYSNTDIIGSLSNKPHYGTGSMEGSLGGGDSGGAAFINGLIAGIASYTATIGPTATAGDIDDEINSSYGEIAGYQRVSYNQEFIDKTVRQNYPDAPKTKEQVKKIVDEDDIYAYFMLEYLPLRNSVDDVISVNYKTIDGTAIAGVDYIATSGQLNLYKDESYAIIAIELLDDNIKESNEYFSLQVSDPNYGSFGDGVVTLTAIRTIVDDDFF